MASLTNTKIKDTYDGLLKTTDNNALGGTYKLITDGLGNSSGVYLGTGGNVGIGTNDPSTKLHVYESNSLDHITIDGNNGDNRNLRFATENSTRWNLYATGTSETGSNVGSDLTIAKYTDAGAYNGNVLTIKRNTGDVGIGTSNPSQKLDVNGNIVIPQGNFFAVDRNGFDNAILFQGNGTFGSADQLYLRNPNNNDLNLQTNGNNTRVTIKGNGNVGIGLSNPSEKLHIQGSVDNDDIALRIENTFDDNSSATPPSAAVVFTTASNNGHIRVFGAPADTAANHRMDIGASASTSYLTFSPSGSEKMRITSGGSIYIGLTNGNLGTDNGWILSPNGGGGTTASFSGTNEIFNFNQRNGSGTTKIGFRNGNIERGSISWTASATAYNTSSDYRLKENVVDLTGALDRVDQLEPKRFNFISDTETTVDGFIAHEVQSVIPEAITGEKDAVDDEGNPQYQGIDQSKIVPLLVGAIKELKAEIETLKSQINS
jgi:hypothetical protein